MIMVRRGVDAGVAAVVLARGAALARVARLARRAHGPRPAARAAVHLIGVEVHLTAVGQLVAVAIEIARSADPGAGTGRAQRNGHVLGRSGAGLGAVAAMAGVGLEVDADGRSDRRAG